MGLFNWLSGNADDIPTKTQCYHIEGFLSCVHFQTAVEAADRLTAKHANVKVDVNAYVKEQWKERSRELQEEFKSQHSTSPFIYEGCNINEQAFVGGYSDFAKRLKEVYKMNVPMD
ncbi:uncharacterized protein BYT42DRAFT_556191 [Radiomyces spectabilis]|uniref:uncharacterized protein n=1 Tax=Radiomyces spectabilis TaxID=64574 RepID=UPI0022202408|nr:uncharacterized protein BYT42DRAFT_556191 [Radiomyces spectabilis]KAI8391257.1 hypothetical protein BYT42DRAFT_556191 [Radiomyces spectabilis]